MFLLDLKKEVLSLLASGQNREAIEKLMEYVSNDSRWKPSIIQNSGIFEQNEKKFYVERILTDADYRQQTAMTGKAILTINTALKDEDLITSNEQRDGYVADIATLDLEPLGKIQLVNSDRQMPFGNYTAFFRQHLKLPYQFYFMVGCPDTQQPRSFAERVVYDIIENVLIDEVNAINYEREERKAGVTMVERTKIPQLPLGIDADAHQRKFRKYFAERLSRFYQENISIEDLIGSKTLQLPFKYFAFIFQIDAEQWDTEVTKYVQWLMDIFKKNAQTQPTFLFFIVVNFIDAYKIVGAKPPALETILSGDNADMCCLITDLMPIPSADINTWFRHATENKFPSYKINNIINKFTQQLVAQERRQPNDTDFNMVDVEELQEVIYVAALKKKE